MEMSSLLEPLSVSGRHVLLAAQKLSIQPNLPEHREELITATQNVFLGVLKVKCLFFQILVKRYFEIVLIFFFFYIFYLGFVGERQVKKLLIDVKSPHCMKEFWSDEIRLTCYV